MRYISLFSGVEAASVAWAPFGWSPVAFSEVDEFPSAVLAHRFPDVPNLGDVRGIDWKEFHERYGTVDVLVGGSPCQSFSIAGSRTGLVGESGLMFEYIRAVRELVRESGGAGPRYILWENVPGALSSERGNAFGQLLAELDELGYGLAWRVLDAQYVRVPDGSPSGFFGPVAQRRRRVFLVGVLGSPHAAEILFERSCLRGDHPKGREAREALAEDAPGGAGVSGCSGFRYNQRPSSGGIGYGPLSPTIDADSHPNGVCYTLGHANGNAVAFEQNQRGEVRLNGGDGSIAGALSSSPAQTKGQGASLVMMQYGDVAGTPSARGDSIPCADRGQNIVCMESAQANAVIGFDKSPTLNASHEQPFVAAVNCRHGKLDPEVVGTIQAKPNGGYSLNYQDAVMVGEDVSYTLATNQDQTLFQEEGPGGYVVRRLTPVECERLQGFPDGWTRIPYRGKPAEECPDTPRYKAIGNSMAVPVMMWLGRRIEAFDVLHYDEVGLGGR